MEDLFFNPLDPDYMNDPHPHLRLIREHLPVHQTLAGPWAVFRYDDCLRLLRDPTLSVDAVKADEASTHRQRFLDSLDPETEFHENRSMLNVDPPDHTRLRRLVSKAFTPRVIESLRPRVQELVDSALDRLEASRGGDVVDELAFPLPFDVISEMLGMGDADKVRIRDWSSAVVKTLDPVLSEADFIAAMEASMSLRDHTESVIEWKRQNPADDLLTALIEAESDGDRLTTSELSDQVVLLFIAGHETTVNLIGTGIYELLRHRDQLEAWRDDDSLATNAVEELLRFVSPVQFSRRVTTSERSFGPAVIGSNVFVLACLASANRDPEFWGPTANELDLRRSNAREHISFGSGAHYCLGAALAKLEGEVAIGSFIKRFPHAGVTEIRWNGRINLRGLDKLTVSV